MASEERRFRAICFYRQQRPASEVVDLISDLHDGSFGEVAQQFLMERCIRDEICRKFEPSHTYTLRLLKLAIRKIEDEKGQVEEDVLNLYMELLGKCKESVGGGASHSCKTFAYGRSIDEAVSVEGHISLNVSFDILAGSTGCKEWEAGFVLAEFVLNNPAVFKGKVSVELGSGAGLVGICLDRVGCSTSVLTDGNIEALQNCRTNLDLNGVRNGWHETKEGLELQPDLGVQCVPLKWEEEIEWRPDVVLGADVVYDPEVIPSLVSTLVSLLRPEIAGRNAETERTAASLSWKDWITTKGGNSTPFALVASTVRNPSTLELFAAMTRQKGLVVRELVEFERQSGGILFHWLPFREKKSAIVMHCISVR
ncbi:hypothetical protein BSKO_12848 [Bryopsis sp. KO-2023]|nr:hypothetical protein BSKO_12848 [Bryopsis sp. KO-2023]